MTRKILYVAGLVILAACGSQSPVETPNPTIALEATVGSTATPQAMQTPVFTVTPDAIESPEISEEIDTSDESAEDAVEVLDAIQEFRVQEIALAGPVSSRNAEISGMAWYGDALILMPQYPKFDGGGNFYALSKAEIETYLMAEDAAPLTPQAIPVNDAGLASLIDGFEGYEAIAFMGDQVYLTVEAKGCDGMRGYLVAGRIAPDLSEIVVETAVITEILPQTDQTNHSDETLLIDGEMIVTIYETNGVDVNDNPMAHRFNADLSDLDTLPFPNIEYRVTDATNLDENSRFWIINYFYPGDTVFQSDNDVLADKYGLGVTHLVYDQVERLVELQLAEDGISLTDTPPILFELPDEEARNWEGIVRFNDGFLLATDKFPNTILAYVER